MELRRFQDFLLTAVRAHPDPAIASVDEWGSVKPDGVPGGVAITSAAGGRFLLHHVHGSALTGSYANNEVVEGVPPEPVSVPALTLRDGQIRLAELEVWLRAVVIDSQFRELASVEAFSQQERQLFHPYGISIRWHNLSSTTIYFRHTLRPGEQPNRNNEYTFAEAV